MSDRRSLEAVGLGRLPQTLIFLVSWLPLVGVVIGVSYTIRKNSPTRAFGRRLLGFSLLVHTVYGCCICPWLIYVTTA